MFSIALIFYFSFLRPFYPSYRSTDLHEIWQACVFLCRVLDAGSKFGKSKKQATTSKKNFSGLPSLHVFAQCDETVKDF